jgi:hypothetical protein
MCYGACHAGHNKVKQPFVHTQGGNHADGSSCSSETAIAGDVPFITFVEQPAPVAAAAPAAQDAAFESNPANHCWGRVGTFCCQSFTALASGALTKLHAPFCGIDAAGTVKMHAGDCASDGTCLEDDSDTFLGQVVHASTSFSPGQVEVRNSPSMQEQSKSLQDRNALSRSLVWRHVSSSVTIMLTEAAVQVKQQSLEMCPSSPL